MKNKLLSFFVILVSVFMLAGCGKQQADSQNDYKLPLGDVAYYTEFDFYVKHNAKNTDETKTISTDYFVANTAYQAVFQISLNADSSAVKRAYLEVGYYEGEEFKALTSSNKKTIEITSTPTVYTYDFTTPATYEEENLLIRVSLGTSVDEEVLGEAYKDVEKSLRGTVVKIYSVDLSYNDGTGSVNKNLLVESVNEEGKDPQILYVGSTSEFIKEYLHYYNTATIEHSKNASDDNSTLVITMLTKTGVWQWIVEMLGVALFWLIKLLGNKYWLGLLVFTILLRTLAWPIYAKSNAYSNNMAKIQPEMQRIQAKYEGRTDQNSQMKQQLEMRELMKKNKVSVFGCLTPFLQMPIFIAVYQVVSRFPLTPKYSTVFSGIDYSFFNTSFGMTYGVAEQSIVLAIIVGLTMIGSQLLSMLFQKIAQKKHENFYTKQRQNKDQNKTMIIFMIVMTVMMVFFALTNAGIAFYWIVGNLYQIGQTALQKFMQEKKEEKERLASGKVRGRE